jgi:DNA-binding phage protein
MGPCQNPKPCGGSPGAVWLLVQPAFVYRFFMSVQDCLEEGKVVENIVARLDLVARTSGFSSIGHSTLFSSANLRASR